MVHKFVKGSGVDGHRRKDGKLHNAQRPVRCPTGKRIDKSIKQDRPPFLQSGLCMSCGSGPLHSPINGGCNCSFVRKDNKRLCRECAIAYDYMTKGHTKISAPPITGFMWTVALDITERGKRASSL